MQTDLDGTSGKIEEYAQKSMEIDQAMEERKGTLAALAGEIEDLTKNRAELTENRKYVALSSVGVPRK